MKPEEMWKLYCKEVGIGEDVPYTADSFAGSAGLSDELAGLILEGKKTATCSAYEMYALDNEPMYNVGDYSVVLDSRGEAVCIIRTAKLTIVPYGQVDADFAYKEGEGDRSLAYWRKVHKDFFENEFKGTPLTFSDETPLVCEEFEVVFRP